MTQKLFRFAYVCEFLLALTAVFIVWPEIGGEDALALMHWGFKVGFGAAMALGIVAYTRTIVESDRIATWPSIAWLVAIAALAVSMGVVTYYYALEAESQDSDEPSGTVTIYNPSAPSGGVYS
jgi:hypothetical protein